MRTLPKNARIAAHPLDSDGIAYLGARANLGGWETIQPWFTKSWQTQRTRAEHTLDAMYATDTAKVLDYARRYDVSHFLVNKHRYRSNYAREAGVFEPLTSHVRQLLRDRRLNQLVFRRVDKDVVVFEHGRFQIVSVDALRRTQRK
jgi:hypothetical protein